MLGNLVPAGDTKIYATLADKSRDVGGRQEDQRNGQVFDQGNVEASLTAELDVGPGEEIEGCLLQTSFYRLDARLVYVVGCRFAKVGCDW